MSKQSLTRVKARNTLPLIQYYINIVFAEKDSSFTHPFDCRYNGWRPIWSQNGTENFYQVLNEKTLNRYIDHLLDYVNNLRIIRTLAKGMDGKLPTIKQASKRNAVVYRYYGSREKGPYRICIELVLMPFSQMWEPCPILTTVAASQRELQKETT